MFEVLGENLVPVSNIYRINSDATLGYLNSNLHLVETKLRVCAGQAGVGWGGEGGEGVEFVERVRNAFEGYSHSNHWKFVRCWLEFGQFQRIW